MNPPARNARIPISAIVYPIVASAAAGLILPLAIVMYDVLFQDEPVAPELPDLLVISILAALLLVLPGALLAWGVSLRTDKDLCNIAIAMLATPIAIGAILFHELEWHWYIQGCLLPMLFVGGVELYRNFRHHRGLSPVLRQYPESFYLEPYSLFILPVIAVGLLTYLLLLTPWFAITDATVLPFSKLLVIWIYLSAIQLFLIAWVKRRGLRMASAARAVWVPVGILGFVYVFFMGYDVIHAAQLRGTQAFMKYEGEGFLPLSKNVALCRDSIQTQILSYINYAVILLAYVASALYMHRALGRIKK